MLSMNVEVPSSKGLKMAGTIDRPDGPAQAYAIFAHCFAGSRHTPGASRIAKRLTEHGIATLRFDFPGLGQSEGEFKDTSFSENVDDIVAAAVRTTGLDDFGDDTHEEGLRILVEDYAAHAGLTGAGN